MSVVNPIAGGSITTSGNLITDIAGGNVPEFKNAGDVLWYAGGLALDGFGAAGVGQIGKYIGVKLAGNFITTSAGSGVFTKVGGATATEAFQVAGVEFSVVSTKIGSAPVQMALQTAKGGAEVAAKGVQVEKSVFTVTKEGIVLPKGAKIPGEFVQNPYRSSSYGVLKDGKFVEKLRIDPATAPGMKGPNYSHFHLNGSATHSTGNWPWW